MFFFLKTWYYHTDYVEYQTGGISSIKYMKRLRNWLLQGLSPLTIG